MPRYTLTDAVFTSNRIYFSNAVQEATNRILEICGGKAETYAKKECPVDTGRLKGSITHQQENEYTEIIGTNTEYAPYVEYGHHQEVGRYVPAIGARLVADFVPGHPYLRPSLENHMSEYEYVMRTEYAKVK